MSDWGRETVTFVEIHQPFCGLNYGVSPCTAVLGTDGANKCFNTLATCQDKDNFNDEGLVVRFSFPQQALIKDYGYVLPMLSDVDITPAKVNLGGLDRNSSPFGKREIASIEMVDARHSDVVFDKYRTERVSGDAGEDQYDPYDVGTFWGKWLARNPFHVNYELVIRQGFVGDSLEDMQTKTYIIDRISGPSDGRVTIEAKDLFARAERRKAVAPKASTGALDSGISDSAGSATLSPSGIGNEEYPASGYIRIGSEVMAFTRSGDSLTLSTRGAIGTTAESHSSDDTVQIVLAYESEELQDIVYDLLTEYAGIAAARIDKSNWEEIQAQWLPDMYTAYITEPTAVSDLIGELAQQGAVTFWHDVYNNSIRMRALRPAEIIDEEIKDERIVSGTFSRTIKDEHRTSQVWVYYGQLNPTESLNDPANYRTRAISADLESETEYGTSSVKTIFSRWIPQFGSGAASAAADRILSIFRDTPLEASFTLDGKDRELLDLGRYFRLTSEEIQEPTGKQREVIMTPVTMDERSASIDISAMQVRFLFEPPTVRDIFIDQNVNNLDLRELYDSLFIPPESGDNIRVTIASGVVIGATSTSVPAFDVGDWPSGVNIIIRGTGRILGHGGRGGRGGNAYISDTASANNGTNGSVGGPALYARYDVNIDGTLDIWGGGGGGGGGGGASAVSVGDRPVGPAREARISAGGGGGGAGRGPGSSRIGGRASGDRDDTKEPIEYDNYENGSNGGSASILSAGSGGNGGVDNYVSPWNEFTLSGGDGGNGGSPGNSGSGGSSGTAVILTYDLVYGDTATGSGGSGGSPGDSIDGNSFVTISGSPDLRGPQIN